MKKQFLFAALAATAGIMTSCSNDDELTSNDAPLTANTIAFSTSKSVNQPMTRSGVTLSSLEGFTVSSVNDDNTIYFADEKFNYADGIFKSNISHYWPTSGTLSFYAISNPGTKNLDSKNVPHYTYEDWGAETDLVAATVIAGEKQMPYPLVFKHLTSQVYVTAESEIKTEELTYKLVSVKMDAPSTGTYSFATASEGVGTWEIDNTKTSEYAFGDVLPLSFNQSGSANPSTCYWNILPVTDGNLDFTVEYLVYQNGKMIADCTGSNAKSCTVKDPNLVAGKRYVYNFILPRSTNDVITFTTTVSDWEDGDTTDENLAFNESVNQHPELTWVLYNDGTIASYDLTTFAAGTTYTSSIPNVTDAAEIVIGNKVTTLPTNCFANCNLKKVTIPKSVTTWRGAFCKSGVESVVLEEGVTSIASFAFSGASNLKSIVIPESVTTIEGSAFNYCESLESVTLPQNLTKIDAFGFSSCTSLKSIVIPKSVTSIGRNPFTSCKSLTSLVVEDGNAYYKDGNTNAIISGTTLITGTKNTVIPDNITALEYGAFLGIDIESITIPSSVNTIGENAFGSCHNLKAVVIPNSVTTIGNYTFTSCSSLKTVKLSENMTEIPTGAFRYCSSLESITIPANITTIATQAFEFDNSIASIKVEGPCTIGMNAFKQEVASSKLTSVEFDGKVTFSSYAVFWGCVNLSTIKYNSLEAPEFSTSIGSTYNAWSSTTSTNAVGYATKSAGKNIFYVPSAATYSETDIDKNKAILFDSSVCGFTLSRTL